MADNAAIARPYAQAVFELASESGQLEEWGTALHGAAETVRDGRVEPLIGMPDTDLGKLTALVVGIMMFCVSGADESKFSNLIRLLAENGRLTALPEIARAYDSLKAEVENRIEVTLTAANPVDDTQQARIVEALKKRFGRDVSLTFELDEKLIGGARLRADDLVIDGSVSTGLEKLATTLAN